jgi:ketosteroid isomerase-like protein
MLKTERKIARTLAHLVAGGALMLVVGAAAIVPAQGQAPAPAPGQPQGPARGRGPGIQLPRQGFEATGQNPANYTPEEAAAVEVVKKWVETSTNHDLAGHMALIDDTVVFRPDPTSALRRGARAYCGAYGFVRSATSVLKIDELFVVGGPSDTLVMIKRTDINSPAETGREGALNGYQVSLFVLARVKNGKITEWYDAPLNKVSGAALRGSGALPPGFGQPAQPGQPAPPPNIPAVCMPYPEGGSGTAASAPAPAQPAAPAPVSQVLSYGTSKPEFWFNPFEEEAARAVRGWFAAWKAGDPLLLGSFVDRNVIFRATSSADLGRGRDDLLKLVCGYIGDRLNLTSLFVIGGDFDTGVITMWDKVDAGGKRTRMGSFFRVQNGLIVEWMDAALEPGAAATVNQNSAACQAVNTALGPTAAR